MSAPLIMADTVNASSVPTGLYAYAGYVDGFQSFAALVERFYPHAHLLSVAINAAHDAAVLDVESGAADPTQIPAWIRRRLAHGQYRPCIYANLSTMPRVKEHLAGFQRSQYRLWVADWNGLANGQSLISTTTHYDACQYENTPGYDLSVLRSDFFPVKKKRPAKIHPKVTAAALTASIVVGLEAAVTSKGLHLSPTEAGAITTLASALAGYFKRSGQVR